jgi:hypothetical protein
MTRSKACAIAFPQGIRVLNAEVIQGLGISRAQIEHVVAVELRDLRAEVRELFGEIWQGPPERERMSTVR